VLSTDLLSEIGHESASASSLQHFNPVLLDPSSKILRVATITLNLLLELFQTNSLGLDFDEHFGIVFFSEKTVSCLFNLELNLFARTQGVELEKAAFLV